MGDVVVVQNHLVLPEIHPDFDPSDPEASLDPRRTSNEDGEPISEWRIPLAAIEEFVAAD